MTAEHFIATVAIVGLVIAVLTLLSGAIDRSGVPSAAVFIVLGLLLGPHGMAVMSVGSDSPMLRAVTTLSLALVLFTDALGLDLKEVRRHAGLAVRVLGPGTLTTAAVAAVAAWWLLDLEPAAAALLGAALASTESGGAARRAAPAGPARQRAGGAAPGERPQRRRAAAGGAGRDVGHGRGRAGLGSPGHGRAPARAGDRRGRRRGGGLGAQRGPASHRHPARLRVAVLARRRVHHLRRGRVDAR